MLSPVHLSHWKLRWSALHWRKLYVHIALPTVAHGPENCKLALKMKMTAGCCQCKHSFIKSYTYNTPILNLVLSLLSLRGINTVKSAGNILDDIGNMFDDLADQLEAMLDWPTVIPTGITFVWGLHMGASGHAMSNFSLFVYALQWSCLQALVLQLN